MKSIFFFLFGFLLALLGIITLFMSASAIMGLFEIKDKDDNYVQFVELANLLCAFLYLVAAYGFFTKRKWTTRALNLAIAVLIIIFIGLGIHIYSGGIYEPKAVYSLILRILITIGFLLISIKYLSGKSIKIND